MSCKSEVFSGSKKQNTTDPLQRNEEEEKLKIFHKIIFYDLMYLLMLGQSSQQSKGSRYRATEKPTGEEKKSSKAVHKTFQRLEKVMC